MSCRINITTINKLARRKESTRTLRK